MQLSPFVIPSQVNPAAIACEHLSAIEAGIVKKYLSSDDELPSLGKTCNALGFFETPMVSMQLATFLPFTSRS